MSGRWCFPGETWAARPRVSPGNIALERGMSVTQVARERVSASRDYGMATIWDAGVPLRHVELTPSQFVDGVTDIPAPVMRGGTAAAALTVPFLRKLQQGASQETAAALVQEAADRIARQLVGGDSRA